MNKIKGFANIPSLANNAAGQVAIFGELSSLSFSFSRYKTNYANATYPGVELVGFTTVNDLNSQITLTTQTSNHILSVIHWVYSQYLISAVPTNANKANFITQLQTQFPAMTSVVINEILTGTVTQRMPDLSSGLLTMAVQLIKLKYGLLILDSRLNSMNMKSLYILQWLV
jgi:hypothetical protein